MYVYKCYHMSTMCRTPLLAVSLYITLYKLIYHVEHVLFMPFCISL